MGRGVEVRVGDYVGLTHIPVEALEAPESTEDVVIREAFEYSFGRIYRIEDIYEDAEDGMVYVLDVESRYRGLQDEPAGRYRPGSGPSGRE